MDGLTVANSSVPGSKWILKGLEKVRTGRQWSSARELQVAEAQLRQKTLVETVVHQHLFWEEVRAGVIKMGGLHQQRAWTRWDNTMGQKVT